MMKKLSLIIAAITLCLAMPTMAQTRSHRGHNNPEQHFRVVGVWQQVNITTDSTGVETEVYLPVWKVLQGDNHFTNFVIASHKAPAFITQEGMFRVISDKYYSERVQSSITMPELQGVEVMMEYSLDEEKGLMRLRYMLPNSDRPLQETWRRVRMEVPQELK